MWNLSVGYNINVIYRVSLAYFSSSGYTSLSWEKGWRKKPAHAGSHSLHPYLVWGGEKFLVCPQLMINITSAGWGLVISAIICSQSRNCTCSHNSGLDLYSLKCGCSSQCSLAFVKGSKNHAHPEPAPAEYRQRLLDQTWHVQSTVQSVWGQFYTRGTFLSLTSRAVTGLTSASSGAGICYPLLYINSVRSLRALATPALLPFLLHLNPSLSLSLFISWLFPSFNLKTTVICALLSWSYEEGMMGQGRKKQNGCRTLQSRQQGPWQVTKANTARWYCTARWTGGQAGLQGGGRNLPDSLHDIWQLLKPQYLKQCLSDKGKGGW